MNTTPRATVVLCYGDSNTNGFKPDRSGRYLSNERWTGILQANLGNEYYVIEEGLGGRTTDLDHYNPAKPSRNGFTYFKACLESHAPLAVVIIMLGTNDLKSVYQRSASQVAGALGQYVDHVRHYFDSWEARQPQIVLISPPYIDENAPAFIASMPQPGIYDTESAKKSRALAQHIKALADTGGCEFLDAATITKTGEDGCHMDAVSHSNLGNQVTALIKKIEA